MAWHSSAEQELLCVRLMERMLLATLALTACTGTIDGGLGMVQGDPTPAQQPGSPAPTIGGEPLAPDAPPLPSESMSYGSHATSLGLRRLTRQEYVNTVGDLFGTTAPTVNLTNDVPLAHFDNNMHGLSVSLPAAQGYQAAAEQLGTHGAQALPMPTGCSRDALTTPCVRAFLGPWLRRGFRRPATDVEVTRFETLFTSLRTNGATSREALAGVLQATLLSSSFLYRTEVGAAGTLDGYELASRLSYLVWNTTPDEALLDAARDGKLATGAGRVAELRRLWAHPRAVTAMTSFAKQWLGVQRFSVSRKDPSVLAGTSATLQQDLELEFRMLVERQLMPQSGSLEQFLAGKTTYVTSELAQLYGLSGVRGPGVSTVSLEGTPRRGALTSGLVIGAHSKESGYSVPQFGAFFRKDVLCQPVPAPPVEAQNAVAPPRRANETYRENFERFTGTSTTCNGCHTFLNPVGYAYLPFDPIGRFSTHDSTGAPYETASALTQLDGKDPQVKDAADLAEQVGKSARAHACFARMAIEFSMGRTLHRDDGPMLNAVTATLTAGNDSLSRVIEAVVSNEAFARRGPSL